MSDTPRTDEAQFGTGRVSVYLARILELELNAANDEIERLRKTNLQLREGAEEQKQRIQSLIAERDTAQTYADQKWKLRREFHDLFGTDDIEQGVAVVREMKNRIKRMEEAGDAAIHEANHGREHDALEIWRKAKEDKL